MSNALTTLDQLRSAASQSSNATAKVASAAAAALEEMHGLKADRATFVSFSIPVTGWKSDSSVPGYTKYIDIKVDGLTAADSVGVDVDPSSSAVARAANFCCDGKPCRHPPAPCGIGAHSCDFGAVPHHHGRDSGKGGLILWHGVLFNAGGGGGSSGGTAADISYDNSKSGISAANVQEAIDALSVLTLTIQAVPAQSGNLTYTGSTQSPTWKGYDSSMMTIGGVTSGINAGTYTATFTPVGKYVWTDGTQEAKSVSWTIGRAEIKNVPAQTGSVTYNGSAQSLHGATITVLS